MKRLPFTRHWLMISFGLLLALSACERPVPRDDLPESPDAVPTTDIIIIPTALPTAASPDANPTPEAGDDTTTDAGTTGDTTAPTDTTGTPTETPPEQATVEAGGEVTHVVKPGETLGQIAQIYDVSIEDIAAANGITNIDSLDVGQTLIIKAGSGGTSETVPTTGEQVHVVQAGENLFRIGLRYGFTPEELAAYNNIPDMTRIDVGQIIKIPPR